MARDIPSVEQIEATLVSMQSKAKYVLGGVGFLAIVGTGDLASSILQESDRWYRPTFLTLLLACGLLLAWSFVRFGARHRQLCRISMDEKLKPSSPAPSCLRRGGLPLAAYRIGLLGVGAAGFVLLLATWTTP